MDENLNGTGVPRCALTLTVRKAVGKPTTGCFGCSRPHEQESRRPPLIQWDGGSTQLSVIDRYFDTTRLFVTENTFGTPFALIPAIFLSPSLSATPSSVTFPFFTMMWIEGTAESAYRDIPGAL